MNTHELAVVPAVPEAPGPARVGIRAIRATDASDLRRFYADLSPESRRSRFLSVSPGLSEAQSVSFCTADHDHREGFVAFMHEGARRGERIVGHLCLEPDGADAAEVAIAVADSFQHQGIGRQLMAAGVDWARRAHVARLTATMFIGNAPIHRLLVGLGQPTRVKDIGAGISEITIDVRTMTAAA
jgi:RimJ/RimL family protein N-acetyltransferase